MSKKTVPLILYALIRQIGNNLPYAIKFVRHVNASILNLFVSFCMLVHFFLPNQQQLKIQKASCGEFRNVYFPGRLTLWWLPDDDRLMRSETSAISANSVDSLVH
ncbi:hypothetical protein T10_4044 [Trichinella papuae]|uniref:Uncharacterized protein n=1 Tax=Trichinella papuae TaxID=268474 RepID=A0A0V1MH92_9BILA|nr:hypothetical protein T10_4044 [Trichinella papuae]